MWESEEAHQRFADERLAPARTRVLGEEAVAAAAPPAQLLTVDHVVRP